MSRSIRLIKLLQELRLHSPPVTADVLAESMGVSQRTIYRDIESLREAGAIIDGAAGYGYSLTEDPALPPQVFTHEEIEALVLGLREVQAVADPSLAKAAEHALAKLHGSLPPRLQVHLKHNVLHAKRFKARPKISIDPALIRKAAWQELALDMEYKDVKGQSSSRRIYPLSIVFLDESLVLISYCCLRKGTRVFRLDRIISLSLTDESFQPRRVRLLSKALKEIRTPASR
jgi:predicted DNA-binding transcriptional regulator YafY